MLDVECSMFEEVHPSLPELHLGQPRLLRERAAPLHLRKQIGFYFAHCACLLNNDPPEKAGRVSKIYKVRSIR